MSEQITAFAPASIGNVAVGFDMLGLALEGVGLIEESLEFRSVHPLRREEVFHASPPVIIHTPSSSSISEKRTATCSVADVGMFFPT